MKEAAASSSAAAMLTSGHGAQSGMYLTRSIALINSRPPKFDKTKIDIESTSLVYMMWKKMMLAYLSALGKLHVSRENDNPIMVGDINVSEEELRS